MENNGRNVYALATPNNLFKIPNLWEIGDNALETSYLPFNSNIGKVWIAVYEKSRVKFR